VLKAIVFGIAIPAISAHAGLYSANGSRGVGEATTRAVVGSCLAVIVLGFFIGLLGQVLLG
ncbi:MAG: ABC transporter permease, partial [Polyangiaceae bacterium]|nr:ABC transporter permease [Polyangiaceae bacterium]